MGEEPVRYAGRSSSFRSAPRPSKKASQQRGRRARPPGRGRRGVKERRVGRGGPGDPHRPPFGSSFSPVFFIWKQQHGQTAVCLAGAESTPPGCWM